MLPPEIYRQRAPCDSCPFRREGGVRHSAKMMLSYMSHFLGWPGATFPCHKSVPADDDRTKWSAWRAGQVLCAGGMIFALKNHRANAVMIAGLMDGTYDPERHKDVDAVFDTPEEMLSKADE